MAPVRQTHLGTWVGKRYGYGDWLQGSWALGPRVHLRLAQEEAAGGAGLAPVAIWGLCHGPILTTYLSPGVPFSAPSLLPLP